MSASVFSTNSEFVEDKVILSGQGIEHGSVTKPVPPSPKQPARSTTPAWGDAASVSHGSSYQIGRRLTELMLVAIQDGEELPSRPSIRGLRSMLSSYADHAKMPLIGMNDEGLLSATWKLDGEQMLSLRFEDEVRVAFAWAVRSGGSKKIDRRWGETTWKDFLAGSRPLFSRFVAT